MPTPSTSSIGIKSAVLPEVTNSPGRQIELNAVARSAVIDGMTACLQFLPFWLARLQQRTVHFHARRLFSLKIDLSLFLQNWRARRTRLEILLEAGFFFAAFVFGSNDAFAYTDPVDIEPEETSSIGRATRNVVLEERRWQGLLAQLNGERSRRSLPPIDLRIISSAGVLWDIWNNKTDVFIGDPFVAASLIHEIAAIPLFVIDEREPSLQRAVIVVREKETIGRSLDLNGRHLAFPRHGSNLVHLLPHSMLLRRGLTVVEMANLLASQGQA